MRVTQGREPYDRHSLFSFLVPDSTARTAPPHAPALRGRSWSPGPYRGPPRTSSDGSTSRAWASLRRVDGRGFASLRSMRATAARPALASRCDRAASIVVTHLSCRRARLIRVRVSEGGRPRFLVNGSEGAVYVVDPGRWECTCPDHHRHGKGCKHALAAWALWRASA